MRPDELKVEGVFGPYDAAPDSNPFETPSLVNVIPALRLIAVCVSQGRVLGPVDVGRKQSCPEAQGSPYQSHRAASTLSATLDISIPTRRSYEQPSPKS